MYLQFITGAWTPHSIWSQYRTMNREETPHMLTLCHFYFIYWISFSVRSKFETLYDYFTLCSSHWRLSIADLNILNSVIYSVCVTLVPVVMRTEWRRRRGGSFHKHDCDVTYCFMMMSWWCQKSVLSSKLHPSCISSPPARLSISHIVPDWTGWSVGGASEDSTAAEAIFGIGTLRFLFVPTDLSVL